MSALRGFWSYVHKDDEAELGRIAQLARDIVSQYEMISDESIDLFLDRDSLEWGDDWEGRIDKSLASIAFFVPIITPRYFRSAQCRRELNFFARRTIELGVKELLLPILYLDVPDLSEETPDDPLIALVKTFNWVDWRELRFADRSSPDYRAAVARLAQRLVDANAQAEQPAAADARVADAEAADDEEPGTVELMAAAEEALPQWAETVGEIGVQIEQIGSVLQASMAEINGGAAPTFAKRLLLLRKLSSELMAPATRINESGEAFATLLHDVDLGFRVIIEKLPAEVADDPDQRPVAEEFVTTVRQLVASSDEGLGALDAMIGAIAPLEKVSRELRPATRALRQGLTLLLEGREVMRGWVVALDAHPLPPVT